MHREEAFSTPNPNEGGRRQTQEAGDKTQNQVPQHNGTLPTRVCSSSWSLGGEDGDGGEGESGRRNQRLTLYALIIS